jgi:hypothetical protein
MLKKIYTAPYFLRVDDWLALRDMMHVQIYIWSCGLYVVGCKSFQGVTGSICDLLNLHPLDFTYICNCMHSQIYESSCHKNCRDIRNFVMMARQLFIHRWHQKQSFHVNLKESENRKLIIHLEEEEWPLHARIRGVSFSLHCRLFLVLFKFAIWESKIEHVC